jgi:CheY-like chemotaxis protein
MIRMVPTTPHEAGDRNPRDPGFASAPVASAEARAARHIAPQEILLVDDDPMILRAMRLMLESDGHIVTTADGGEAAFSVLAAKTCPYSFPVVMTDLEMPNVDGCQVACAVKTASPGTLVFLLTGWAERFTTQGILPAFVDRVLNKPPQRNERRDALQLVGRRQ